MKILVIGHSVKDHIHTKKGEIVSPGGIYYSLIGMTNFLDKNDEVFLVTSMDKKNEHMFNDRFKFINNEYIEYVEKIPVVHLHHHGSAERCEHYENITNKLNVNKINDVERFDGIHINMITGFDISLDDLEMLRKKFKGMIYLDIHTLCRGIGENGSRDFRFIPDADRWITNVNIIQCNESELKTLSDGQDELERINNALSLGLMYLIITRGENGVDIYWKEDSLKSYSIPAIKINAVNKIGCGDILGSVFFYHFLRDKDVKAALTVANTAAGLSTGYSKMEDFNKLKDDTFSRFN